MTNKTGLFCKAFASIILLFGFSVLYGQQGFDNSSRALYIYDLVAKYVNFGEGFADSSNFRIGMMLGDYELLYELGNLAKTRPRIQDKPVQISGYKKLESITHTQVLYVNKSSGFDLQKIQEKISGQQTLLVTEGYEFRESMINFIVINGVPRYEINEEYIKKEGMSVPQTFLFTAVKTKEDWEKLFEVTDADLQVQKETVKQQQVEIELQKAEILRQKALLDSLDREIALKEKTLLEKQRVLNIQMAQINIQQKEISVQKQTIIVQQQEVQVQKDTLLKQKEKIDLQIAMIDEQLKKIGVQEEKIKVQLATLEKQKLILWFVIVALALVSFLGYYIYRSYRIKKEANIRLEEKNRTISMQKDEIEQQRDLAAAQRDQIAYQKKHITDSIMYAKRIQTALIPSLELFSDKLEHFVLYKPLAIVSGDFYWVSNHDDKQIIIAADCTGHGVPGAFMSMLGVTLLNEIVNNKQILLPDQIIENLRHGVIKSLNQVADEDSVKDGMDISVCVVDFKENVLLWAGANNPLYVIRGGELIHYRPDKMPASIHYRMQPFTLHKISLNKGDAFYIFSDGFADQFGGPGQRKFMSNKLKETLVGLSGVPMLQQADRLNTIFEEWRGDSPQVDDVTIIGVRY
ncbi:MAG: YfiR/HmsC family protein [Bacteroidales bacterium]|jgi:serine phosphatase RsbU (regulator of sigma subunit)|nr:YfiR/HmsC family protein [Bacteroidales bacterium]